MGRRQKSEEEKVAKTTVSLDRELMTRVRDACAESKTSFSAFVSDALELKLRTRIRPRVRKEIDKIQTALDSLVDALN